MTMAIMYSWAFLLIFLAHGTDGSGAALTSQDEFILVACGNRILSGNVDGTDFVEVFTHYGEDIEDVDFDPVNEKIYFTDGFLHRVDTDGTNYEMLLPEDSVSFIDLDYKHGYLYYVGGSEPNQEYKRVHLRDIVFTNVQAFLGVYKTVDIISYLVEDKSGFIFYSSSESGDSIEFRDLEGNLCKSNSITRGIEGMALDYDDAMFYMINQKESTETVISSFLISAGDTIGQQTYGYNYGQSMDPIGSNNRIGQSTLTYYDGYLYVPFDQSPPTIQTASRLGRFSLTSNTWEFLAPSVVTDIQCQNVHIHNPLTGVETFNQESGRKSAVVETRREYLGGFIADVSFNIGSNELTRIELVFPRQVYTLEIVGCDLHQRRKKQIMKTGQRKGTKYTLIPNPDSTIEAGEDGKIRFRVIGKTWRNIRGFKAPIIADVYYRSAVMTSSFVFNDYGSAQDASRCELPYGRTRRRRRK